MTTILGKSNEIEQLLTQFSSTKDDEKLLINEITKYLKSTSRSRAEDEEILIWLLENNKIETFVKLLSDHNIFGPSSIEMLSHDDKRPNKPIGRQFHGQEPVIQLEGRLFDKALEALYIAPVMRPFFEKIEQINTLTKQLQESKKQVQESLNADPNNKTLEKNNSDILSELQRILNELRHSIYLGDLNYIYHLLSFLPPELRNAIPIFRFVEAIKEQKETQNLEDQRSYLYSETDCIISGCKFFEHLHSNINSTQEADLYIRLLMDFGLGIGYHIIKDSKEFLDNFEQALTKSNFNDVRDKDGNTLLHRAVAEGQVEMVDTMLKLHADNKINIDFANAKNRHGHTVEVCAQEGMLKGQLLRMLAAAKAGRYHEIEVQHGITTAPTAQSFVR